MKTNKAIETIIGAIENIQNDRRWWDIVENPESFTYQELCDFEALCEFSYWMTSEFPVEIWTKLSPVMKAKLEGLSIEKVEKELGVGVLEI